ncbi:MAG: beta-ketoacyl-[acyl-carrier-protein] synthase family protein [Miltoncostaeaceae bacterium]
MATDRRRVVITGVGAVSSVGLGTRALWDALAVGRSGARRMELDGLGPMVAFAVDGLEEAAEERFGRRDIRRMDRVGQMAAVAGGMALDDAGDMGVPSERIGIALGCVHGGAATAYDAHRALIERGADRVSPLSVPLSLTNGAGAAAARVLGLRGPSTVITTACAAGTDAVGFGLDMIRLGRADAALVGGAEAPLSPVVAAGYLKMGALSRGEGDPRYASRPFDRGRDGFVMGEAAGVVVLEERGHALARGATILAELAGYGASCDAGHPTDPDPAGEGAARAIAAALADAGVAPGDIGYVNAHATSTPAGDVAEMRAIARAGLGGVPVSSTKSAHGHGLGAAGGIELAALLMAFSRDLLPGNLNLEHPEDAVALDLIEGARPAHVDAVLSNSFGFGGHNSCIVVTRHRDD